MSATEGPHIICGNGMLCYVDQDIYDEFNKFTWTAHKPGKASTYYVERCIYLKEVTYRFSLHRIVMDALPDQYVDHIDRNGLNNRRCNLRIVTHQENMCNQSLREVKSSLHRGVSWHKGRNKWQAGATVNRKGKYLGVFENEQDAARAYDKFAATHYGSSALLNFPTFGKNV